ncbi:flagellar basal body P-ring formation chaperone FlgA [Limnohabitans sp. TEGF004]|uniref:flagellar basal body P-ring formation chaperone FlgA n=1 Tax=Limnohabitans sp. TEGF004 TaxID=2986281 RepID=UPI00248FC074|nr:flagellar basal body P-ring formation chaperone FlgA [Limnohabitans sp. TEGF004]
MTMQMPCLKNADTSRLKRWSVWLAACVLSQAQLGFAADSTLPDSAFEALQKQAHQWAATHPSFQGKQVQVVPVDPRITVQTCQQNLQFEQPFPNQPAIRVRCAQPAWQLFVNLNTGQANTPVNRASPSAPALYKVLVSKELLKRGTVIKPEMFSYAEMPAAGMENQIISDTKLLKNMELVRDLTPNTPLRSYDVKTAVLVKRGQEVQVTAGEGQGFSITMRAEALQDGGLGEQIRLKNVESGRLLHGVITGPNAAKLR